MRSTCLGCGCACDDIELRVEANRIVDARHACPLGVAWFGDGSAPSHVRIDGGETTLDAALDRMAAALIGAARPLVYLAGDLSCEAQRDGIALADGLRASLASLTSSTAIASVLAAQEQGRAGATLGEIRNRADLLVFWGVDPAVRYPRYWTRYAPEPIGVHVPDGRRSRRVIAVDVGSARGPADADLRMHVEASREMATLARLTAAVSSAAPSTDRAGTEGIDAAVVDAIRGGRYVTIVADAEPADGNTGDALAARRAAALIALTHALNATTRGALSALRGGGNRSGADACTTSQTGYPASVDFARGYPRYRPYDGVVRHGAGPDVVLVLGDAAAMPAETRRALGAARQLVAGPRASAGPLSDAAVVVDTGVAGIHEEGTAIRMDDIPLPLRSPIAGPVGASAVIRQLADRVRLRDV